MKHVTGYGVAPTLVDEIIQSNGGIGTVGISHARSQISESPPRRALNAPDENGDTLHHVFESRSIDEVVVDIPVGCLVVAVIPVIRVDLFAHIEDGVGEIVVEQPVGNSGFRVEGDIDRPVLVQRVPIYRGVAERIEIVHSHTHSALVQGAGTLAESVVGFATLSTHIVKNRGAASVEAVGPTGKVRGEGVPRTIAPLEGTVGTGDARAELIVGNRHRLFVHPGLNGRTGEYREVVPQAPLARDASGHVGGSAADHPGAVESRHAVGTEGDPAEPGLEYGELQACAPLVLESGSLFGLGSRNERPCLRPPHCELSFVASPPRA